MSQTLKRNIEGKQKEKLFKIISSQAYRARNYIRLGLQRLRLYPFKLTVREIIFSNLRHIRRWLRFTDKICLMEKKNPCHSQKSHRRLVADYHQLLLYQILILLILMNKYLLKSPKQPRELLQDYMVSNWEIKMSQVTVDDHYLGYIILTRKINTKHLRNDTFEVLQDCGLRAKISLYFIYGTTVVRLCKQYMLSV